MNGRDAVIYDGEVKVVPRTVYDIIECIGGQPICRATFANEDLANEYAANQRQKGYTNE